MKPVVNMKQQHFIANILDSLPDPIVVLDDDGIIIMVNQAWRQFAVDNQLSSACDFCLGQNYLTLC